MSDYPILWEWLSFAVRWAHVVAAIGWIGASFYFIALDLSLRKPDGLPEGVRGEEWQVHGGGFYHVQKYMVAPPGITMCRFCCRPSAIRPIAGAELCAPCPFFC